MASELVTHAVADAAEAETMASDRSTAPLTTQKAAAKVTVEPSQKLSHQELEEVKAELQVLSRHTMSQIRSTSNNLIGFTNSGRLCGHINDR